MFRNGRRIEIRHEMPWIATKTGLEAKLFQMFTGKHVIIFGYFLAFFKVLNFFLVILATFPPHWNFHGMVKSQVLRQSVEELLAFTIC